MRDVRERDADRGRRADRNTICGGGAFVNEYKLRLHTALPASCPFHYAEHLHRASALPRAPPLSLFDRRKKTPDRSPVVALSLSPEFFAKGTPHT